MANVADLLMYRFEPPGPEERRRYFALWNDRLEPALLVAPGVIADIADRTAGFSFAFLQEVVLTATVRWVAEPDLHSMPDLLRGEVDSLVAQRRANAAVSPQRVNAGT